MTDEQASWDVVRELLWHGQPLMVEAANEITRLRELVNQYEHSSTHSDTRCNTGRRYRYGVLIHDRQTENDPYLATIMYTRSDDHIGPWHPMAVCDHSDHAQEIVYALEHECDCDCDDE